MTANETLIAVLRYVARGLPVFPVNPSTKAPLISAAEGGRGLHDATLDEALIWDWFRRWPHALAAAPTGAITGLVVLGIDESEAIDGWCSLEIIGVSFAPQTPMSHTPRGGTHLHFGHPGGFVKTIAGKLGPGLDIRGDGGSIILPPGPLRRWDPYYNPDTVPLAPMPTWMVVPEEPETQSTGSRSRRNVEVTPYGLAALEGAVRAMLDASAGEQRTALNREAYGIGQLVAAGEIPADLAIGELVWAAGKVRSLYAHRPWRAGECKRIIQAAFLDGQSSPRQVRHG